MLVASVVASAFVACSDDDETSSYTTKYNANTSNIASVGTAVDLGLPSGTKWADKNVGAASAQDFGLNFIWSDITGTQVSTADTTYSNGKSVALKDIFEQTKGGAKTMYDTIELAKKEIIVELVDSIRDNYSFKIVIDRHAKIKVKDEKGQFVVDEKGEFVRKDSIFHEIDSLIYMAHTRKEAIDAFHAFIKPYKEDSYNNYKILDTTEVYWNDTIQKLVPKAGEIDLAAYIAEAKKKSGKSNAWYYIKDAEFKTVKDHNDLYANLIVESFDTINYFEGKDAEVTALSIVGNAEYDAEAKNWGSDWAMPTTAQLQELIDKCEWTFTDNGYTVTGPNGASIFLPAAGYRYGSDLIGNGASGYYASGELNGKYIFPDAKKQHAGNYGSITNLSIANILIFNYGQFSCNKKIMNNFAETNIGLSIRPVSTK